MAEFRLRIDTSSDRAIEFITKLSEDDDFRAQLQQEPRKVLWDYGVELPDELIPDVVELPSKEYVRAALARDPEGFEQLRAGPELFFPIFVCFFAFPMLTGKAE